MFIFTLIFTALLPDMDMFPGIITGDLLRYHRVYTHTMLGAAVFCILVLIIVTILKAKNKTLIITSLSLAYVSHLILDLLGVENYPQNGIGVRIFYPFSNYALNFPLQLYYFEIVSKGKVNPNLFSASNILFFFTEIITSVIIGFIIYRTSKFYVRKYYS